MSVFIFRFSQVLRFGWKDALKVSKKHTVSRVAVYGDMIKCFFKYRLRSLQYVKEDFWAIGKEERDSNGVKYKQNNINTDNWTKDHYENRRFLNKWSKFKWETSGSRYHKRLMAYKKRYNMGDNCIVHYDVILERNHGLNGSIKIGNNVSLTKHVYIDYSGSLEIGDDVAIAQGVIIETHTHAIEQKGLSAVPGYLVIEEGVKISARSYIADTCHRIGRNSRIGAGSFVRGNVPPYAIVIGNPAKIVGFLYTPKEIVEFEKEHYPEEKRLPIEVLEQNYEKYFKNRFKDIKEFVKQ